MLRRIRLVYNIYNFFHKNELAHNLHLYKKLGLNKKYYSSISSKDFKHLTEKPANAKPISIESTDIYKEADEVTKKSIADFEKNGYIILKKYFTENQVEEINSEIEKLLIEKKIKFKYGNKIMFAINQSPLLKSFGSNSRLIHFLSSVIKGEAKLFQSINFMMGSEQKSHSDSIHMTTYPLGGLLGVWIALEEIGPDNGPLHYYPGSQKLPYYLNSDYDNEGNSFMIGNKGYSEYEKMLEEKIDENKIQKKVFLAEKGDVLIWHANLFHGGEPHTNKSKTRKSMVLHYFDLNCVCYHEITQRPSLFK